MVDAVTMVLLSLFLVAAAVCDVRTGRVFNWLTYPAIGVGLAWATIGGAIGENTTALEALGHSGLALGAGLIGFALVFAAGGLGGGDVKVMAAVGALSASWQCVLATAFYGFVAGALIAVFVMIRRRLVGRTFSRLFGAALMYGAKAKVELPEDTANIPFALALCMGGILAGAETLLNVPMPWSPAW